MAKFSNFLLENATMSMKILRDFSLLLVANIVMLVKNTFTFFDGCNKKQSIFDSIH